MAWQAPQTPNFNTYTSYARQRGLTPPNKNFWNTFAGQNKNPFSGFQNKLEGMMGSMGNPYENNPWKQSDGSYSFGTHVARPGDPEVQDYMQHTLSGQRNALQDYVKQAAGAGIKRGGMNVAGGPGLDASLHSQAMNSLAGGYANRFREAMDYNKYAKGQASQDYMNYLGAYNNLLGQYRGAMGDAAGWDRWLAGQQANEYDDNYQRGLGWNDVYRNQLAQNRALTQQAGARSAQFDADTRARQLMARNTGSGSFGTPYNAAQLNQMGQYLQRQGYMEPGSAGFPRPF
jgi:hypothetical protein